MTIDLKDRLYTSSEVAEILGVSLRSVYRYLEEGKLDADIKTATGRHRFSRKNILDFLKPSESREEFRDSKVASSDFKFDDSMDDLDDLLDLPALSKSSLQSDKGKESLDDFDFDFDDEFFKNLEKMNSNDEENSVKDISKVDSTPYDKVKEGEYYDDELEKLLREFEEKEALPSEPEPQTPVVKNTYENDDTDELSDLLKNLERSLESESNLPVEKSEVKKENIFDDFDFDFSFDSDEKVTQSPSTKIDSETHSSTATKNIEIEESEDEEDNWLERFRKAAQKNTAKKEEPVSNPNTDFSSMFEKNNLDVFFDKPSETPKISSIMNSAPVELEESFDGRYEYYYTSTLGGLMEIAQNVDKVAKKFDIDYAFTLNAGLSLHKPIAPFSVIHIYVRDKDLELFEDYLNLNPSSEGEASVCLITQESNEVFRDCYDLHGLSVVSNVQLRSDLIDKGLDKLAREI